MATLESVHPYITGTNITYSYTEPGSPAFIYIHFDVSTTIRDNYTLIYITNGLGQAVGPQAYYLTSASLRDVVFKVAGDTVNVRLEANSASGYYGFLANVTTTNPLEGMTYDLYAYPNGPQTLWTGVVGGTLPILTPFMELQYDAVPYNGYSDRHIFTASASLQNYSDTYLLSWNPVKLRVIAPTEDVVAAEQLINSVSGAAYSYVNNQDRSMTFTDTSDFGGVRTGTYLGYGDSPIHQRWTFGDGTVVEDDYIPGGSITHEYTTTENKTVKFEAWAGANAPLWTKTQTVPVTGALDARIGTPTHAYMTFNFVDASVPALNIVSWLWDFGDGTTSTDQNPTHEYTSLGAKTVTLTVTDDLAVVDSATYTINNGVLQWEPFSVSFNPYFSPTQNYFDYTQDVIISSVVVGGYGLLTYSWQAGDGTTYATPNLTHRYAAPGVYDVRVSVTESGGPGRTVSFGASFNDVTVKDITPSILTSTLAPNTVLELGTAIDEIISCNRNLYDDSDFSQYISTESVPRVDLKMRGAITALPTPAAPFPSTTFAGTCNRLGKFYLYGCFIRYDVNMGGGGM